MNKIILVIIFCFLYSFPCKSQNKVSFLETLGISYKTYVKSLLAQDYYLQIEREGYNKYNRCKECFLIGRYDDNPAVAHITASHKTQTVFKVEVILREFIDREEAIEEADRLLPQLRDEHQFRKTEVEMPGVTMIEMPSSRKRTTKYMCYPVVGMRVRYYESQEKQDANESFGSVSIKVYQNSLGHEHIVVLDYYDKVAGKLAEAESGKTN